MNKNLLYISTFLVGICFPLSTKITNVAIIIFCLFSVFFCYRNRLFKKQAIHLFLYTTIALFFISAIWILAAENTDTAFKHFSRRVLFLILPLILCFFDRNLLGKIIKYSFNGLWAGCLLSGLYLLGKTLNIYFDSRSLYQIGPDLFNYYHTYHNFTAHLQIHPTYLGSYFYIAIVFVLLHIQKTKKHRLFFSSLLLFLIIIEFFINSRIILFLVLFTIFLFFIWFLRVQFKKNKIHFTIYLTSTLLFIGTLFLFVKDTYIYYRFTKELQWETSKNVNTKINKDNGGDSRLARWSSIIELIKDKPLIGYGTGNEKEVLERQFIKDGLTFSVENRYDSHNLYLSYFIQFGLVGVIVFIIYLFGNICVSIKSKNILLGALTCSVLLISIFENFLNNNAGIVYVAFFQNVLLLYSLKKK